MKTTISFTLDTDKDRDLLRWLKDVPARQRSRTIREALRSSLGPSGITLADVYQAIQDLKRSELVISGPSLNGDTGRDEPEDIAANLDRLGL